MVSQKVTIMNELGLHARPASVFVKAASKFESEIDLLSGGRQGIAKSIISVLALSVSKGDELEIIAKGKDEDKAVEALVQLVKEGFGEA